MNLDDSMSGSGKGRNNDGRVWGGPKQSTNTGTMVGHQTPMPEIGLPPQNLCGVPWRAALALQADGWHLRSATVWKKNGMCESMEGWQWERHRVVVRPQAKVTDGKQAGHGHGGLNERWHQNKGKAEYEDCPGCPRCAANNGFVLSKGNGRPTETYEIVFILAKSLPHYWDSWAVRQPPPDYYRKGGTAPTTAGGSTTNGIGSSSLHSMNPQGGNLRNFWTFPEVKFRLRRDLTAEQRAYVFRRLAGVAEDE